MVKQELIQGIDVTGVKRWVMIKMRSTEDILDVMTEHEEQFDMNDMLIEDEFMAESVVEDDQGCPTCGYDDHARDGFVSYQVDEDGGYEERPCPTCNENDHKNKKCCEKCNGTGMYYDDPEKAKIRTGRY